MTARSNASLRGRRTVAIAVAVVFAALAMSGSALAGGSTGDAGRNVVPEPGVTIGGFQVATP